VTGPIRVTFGKTNFFQADGYDVLYVEVISPDLEELNARLSDSLDVTTTHPVYTPHATVAYLLSGLGDSFAGRTVLEGMSASIGMIKFSPAEGPDEMIDLAYRASEDAEMLEVLTAAIQAGNLDVVARVLGGPGSGNFNHEGRPGAVGGSGGSGGFGEPRDPHAVGTVLDKLMKKHGADWAAELTKYHQKGMVDDLFAGRINLD
jgi:hypothetical protein